MGLRLVILALALAALWPHRVDAAACGAGVTTCATDTTSDAAIVAAIRDPTVGLRVYELWLGQCLNIWSELASTTGHILRTNYCNQIAAGAVNRELLVAVIMSATVQSEVLGSCTIPVNILGNAAGCMVDADVITAIGTALTVTTSTASTTATAATGSTLLTVASATGIVAGQSVSGAGIPGAAVVLFVSGTSVAISAPTTAALSATPVLFTISAGLP